MLPLWAVQVEWRVPTMTAPLRYTREEMMEMADTLSSLHSSFQDAMDGAEISLSEIAAMLRQAAAEGQERADIIAVIDAVAPIGERTLLQAVKDEMHDYQMVMRHCSRIYDAVTMGRVSKPTTLPRVVMHIAEELEAERTEEAIKEALDSATPTDPPPPPVAEPRGTCGTCKHFSNDQKNWRGENIGHCANGKGYGWPADGSGFCHLWEAK